MKRLLLCSLAAVMILSFAACTNGADGKKDDQTGKQSQTGVQQGSNELVPEWVDGETYTPPITEPVDDGSANQQDPASGNQTEEPDQHKVQGQGALELVPEWVDGQEYPQGEPMDDGAGNQQSSGNQKEDPAQHNLIPD